MKHILKNAEPAALSAWKTQEAARLESYYSANNANAAWNHLSSNPPAHPESGIQYYSKEELTLELLKEQGYLCCYCNRNIHTSMPKIGEIEFNDRRTTVEHLEAKEADARNHTFRYENLAASCMGGETLHKGTKPRVSYCNLRRQNTPLAIMPTKMECEQYIYYTLDGQILGDTHEIETTLHDVLGLHFFDAARKAAIRAYYYSNVEEHEGWEGNEKDRPELKVVSTDNARQIIKELSKKDKQTHGYQEFCQAIIQVLKNDILGDV